MTLCDVLLVKFKTSQSQIITVLTIYRPPNNNHIIFFKEFSDLIHQHISPFLIILGDFNFHFNSTSYPHNKFKDICNELCLSQHVTETTHISGNVLDLIFTHNNYILLAKQPTNSTLLTDHYAIKCTLNIKKYISSKLLSYRHLRNIDLTKFSLDILSNLDINNFTITALNNTLSNLLDTYAPLNNRTIKIYSITPWFNHICHTYKKNTNILNKIYNKNKNTINHDNFLFARSQYRKQMKSQKTMYYNNKINLYKNDSKKLFKLTNQLMGRNKRKTFPPQKNNLLVNKFSNFFDNKISNICDNISKSKSVNKSININCFDTCSFPNNNFNNFITPTHTEIYNLIITAKCTSPNDPLPLSITKKIINTLTPLYHKIINISLTTGIIPPELTHAIITPILKNASLDDSILSNYRPLSQLPLLSKILEKVIYKQLISYLDYNDLFDNYQSAYRKHHSTETSIIALTDSLHHSLDNHKSLQLLFIDMTAAFDTIDFTILLSRLSNIGITGTAFNWFKSFITTRTYSVKINSSFSQPYPLNFGVPQGSVLSPILFSIYLRPLSKLLQSYTLLKYNIYADDIVLHTFATNSTQNNYFQDCINSTTNWLTNNNLLINSNKTKLINISRTRTAFPNIYIGTDNITPITSTKYLGITISQDLSTEIHVKDILKSASYNVYNLKKIRPFISLNTAKILSTSLIISKLNYCNSFLYKINTTLLKKCDSIINRCIRIIFKIPYTDYSTSISELRSKINWHNTKQSIIYKILTITHKSIVFKKPMYIYNMLQLSINNSQLRSNSTINLELPKINSSIYGELSYRWYAPYLWNKLPSNIKNMINHYTFKKHLHRYILNNY